MKKVMFVTGCLFLLAAVVVVGCNDDCGVCDCQQLADRVEFHAQMAEDYFTVYDQQTIQEGAAYESWEFADDAIFWSPYFTGGEIMDLGAFVQAQDVSIAKFATMEALAFTVKFPDWGPVEFQYWPHEDGFVMRTLFVGHHRDTGEEWRFYAHGFVWTNEQNEIERWETWVDERYDPFFVEAVGVGGPWHGPFEYFMALQQFLADQGLLEQLD